jgi:uncharacterized protein YjbI with pentapeptide repeats
VPVAGFVVLTVAVVVLVALWRWVDGLALADPEKRAAAQLDVIKTASGIAVGGGGLFALYLAARRQRTQELELEVRRDELHNRQVELAQRDRTQAHVEHVSEVNRLHAEQVAADGRHDAAERRLTDIYTSAAEQFSSDNLAVQLAGLYGFERLANDHPQLRQTVVNVICSFLRMPLLSPAEDAVVASKNSQVRSAAQRILLEHLRPLEDQPGGGAARTHWEVNLDLSEATLENFSLAGCRIGKGVFAKSLFVGGCDFTSLSTGAELDLTGTLFRCPLLARDTRISGDAMLDHAVFESSVDFDGSHFTGAVSLREARLTGDASFDRCRFVDGLRLTGVRCSGAVGFTAVTFSRVLEIESTTFEGPVAFRGADFLGDTLISATTFLDETWFTNAEFITSTPLFSEVAFKGDVWFHGVGLRNGILFDQVSFEGAADLDDCDNAGANDVRATRVPLYRQWPTNWREGPGHDEEWQLFVDNAGPRQFNFPDVLWDFGRE